MSAIVPIVGVLRKLDRPAEPNDQITPDNVQDPDKLSRLIMGIARDVAGLKRRFAPRHIDFEDRTVDATGTTKYRFDHGFTGRVRWWPVDWTGAAAPALSSDPDTKEGSLVLISYVEGTVSVRVEEAG